MDGPLNLVHGESALLYTSKKIARYHQTFLLFIDFTAVYIGDV